MLRLTLDEATLRSVRVLTSPLWETIGSLLTLVRYGAAPNSPYAGWAGVVRAGMTEDEVRETVRCGRDLTELLSSHSWVPLPSAQDDDVYSELHALSDHSPDNETHLRVLDCLERHWVRAVAPWWSTIHEVLQDEVSQRGLALATGGVNRMLDELGGRVGWRRPVLVTPFQSELRLTLTNSELVLVPSAFAGGLRILTVGSECAGLSYPAHGAALARAHEHLRRGTTGLDRLVALLGRGRAGVLRALVVPTTTTSLAELLGAAPSTVSEHLIQLLRLGVVRRSRVGNRVLYELDGAGYILLREFDD